MSNYKNIIINRYALNLSYKEPAEKFNTSKSGINDFLRAFEKCDKLSYFLLLELVDFSHSELSENNHF